MRSRLRKRDTGIRIDQMLRIMLEHTGLHVQNGDRAFSSCQCQRNRVLYTLIISRDRLQLIHDKLDKMRFVSVQFGYS